MSEMQMFESAVKFTAAYKEYAGAHKAIREAMCLKAQHPALMMNIEDGDRIAGRPGRVFGNYLVAVHTFGYGSAHLPQAVQQSGYCLNMDNAAKIRAFFEARQDAARLKELEEIVDFWKKESTLQKYYDKFMVDPNMAEYRLQNEIYDELGAPLGSGFVAPGRGTELRFGGVYCDFDLLLRNGLPGMRAIVGEYRAKAIANGAETAFYDAELMTLDTIRDTILYYRDQALAMVKRTDSLARAGELKQMAAALTKIADAKPEHFLEALQLMWIYSMMTVVSNYSRMDVYMGDFYANDIDSGLMTEEEAVRILESVWKLIFDTISYSDGRVNLGGRGRRNPENADRFCIAAMEATRRFKDLIPTLTLRLYDGLSGAVVQKALDVVGEGCLYPTFYNDDVLIDGIARIMNVPVEAATAYLPLGCGEMCLEALCPASPNETLNVGKAVELLLHDGYDGVYRRYVSPRTGTIDTLDSFEKVIGAFKAQIDYALKMSAYRHKKETDTVGEDCPFLMASLLYKDCLERGKGLYEGGARYLGGCTEGFGFTNAADSLYVIKKLVFDDKIMTLAEMVEALDANFEGYEKERQIMIGVPKFGNGEDGIDALVAWVYKYCNERAAEFGREVGLDVYFTSSVNPGAITNGKMTAATPDGRKLGEPFAIGNSPTAGRDTNGLAALLKSVGRIDPANGGNITNLKLSREMFTKHRATLNAALETYYKNGGAQLNITTVDKADLENALAEPEKYKNLIVRIGGWAGRFVELNRVTKKEIIDRTQY